MSRSTLFRSFAAAAMICGYAGGASAQMTGVSLAPYAGLNVDAEEILLGGSVGIPVNLGTTTMLLSPGLEFYPGWDAGSLVTLAMDVHFALNLPQSNLSPYVGGGIAVHRQSIDLGPTFGSASATDSQLNALGGLHFGSGPFRPFVEANLRFIDGSQLVFKGGGRIALQR